MKKKIYLYLSGGLGNQLFQYAFAKNLSIKNKINLVVDTYSAYIFDFQYFRKKKLKIKFKEKFIFFFILIRFLNKLRKLDLIHNFFDRIIVNEFSSFKKFNNRIKNIPLNKNIYLFGLFQSKNYFIENENKILKDIFPKTSKNNKFIVKKKEIIKKNSVAICFRNFEEASTNSIKLAGGIASQKFYFNSLKLLEKKIKNPHFYIFSQNLNSAKNIINNFSIFKICKYDFIVPENGFEDENDTLWLLSYCKNLIIPNSTFYWWGAYFSQKRYNQNFVICSNNFPNKNIYHPKWKIMK